MFTRSELFWFVVVAVAFFFCVIIISYADSPVGNYVSQRAL
jgi:hypothetical protein